MNDEQDQNQEQEPKLEDVPQDSEETPSAEGESESLPHATFDTEIRAYTDHDLESELAPRSADAEEESLVEASADEEVPADPELTGTEQQISATEQFYAKCELPLKSQIEAVLFASQKCLHVGEIADLLMIPEDRKSEVESAIQELIWEYQQRGGGFRLEPIRGHGFQFRTVADAAPLMKRMFASRPRPLSRASLETLSIIAYRQPATRAEIEYIRGVDAGSIIKHLLERNLIACVGRKEEAGRPMLFGTTAEFLQVFGFSSVKDLPSLASFQAATETLATSENAEQTEEAPIELATGDFMDHSDEARNLDVSTGLVAEEHQHVSEGSAEAPVLEASELSELSEVSEEELDFVEETSLIPEEKTRKIQGAVKAESFEAEDATEEKWQNVADEDEKLAVPETEETEDEISNPE